MLVGRPTSSIELAGASSLRAAAIVLLLGLVAIRLLGPGDLWDQSQPRTIAYTADMLVQGGEALLLPRDGNGMGATKPPFYNWLALPFVALLGRDSELGHKLPSLIALALVVMVTAHIGERLRRGAGWCAAIMLVSSYPMLKLGYLARPDMVLVLVLLLGWWAATRLIVGDGEWSNRRALSSTRALRATFWMAFVLAAWTKGPPALLLLLHAATMPRAVLGSWSPTARIGWWWLLPAVLAALAWPIAVAAIDRDHLVYQLWQNEFLGRVIGTSRQGGGNGLSGVAFGVLDMPFYFVMRFLPWSVLSVAGAIGVFVNRRRCGGGGDFCQRTLESSVCWALLALVVFSLSSGKRADYLAPIYPMAALLAGWWLCDAMATARRPAVFIVVAYVTMVVLWWGHWTAVPSAPGAQDAVDEVERLTRGERKVMEVISPQGILLACGTPAEHLAALHGSGRPCDSSRAGVRSVLDAGRTVRLVYEPEQAPRSIRSRIDDAMLEGRWRLLWRVQVPWKGPRTRIVECVEIRGRDSVE